MKKISIILLLSVCIFIGQYIFSLLNLATEVINYSTDEIEIAKTIAMEACGEGTYGMLAVASVIQNRSREWGMSYYDVVASPYQFVGFTHPNRDARFRECRTESLALATHLDSLTDITEGALYFKRPEETKQPWHRTLTTVIGNHEFYR